MKRLFIVLFFVGMASIANAQLLKPVMWTFSSKKIADKTYEIHLTANIQPGWHLFSQIQPADAISIPTAIAFNKNPLVMLDGKTAETGKMEVYSDKRLGISAHQYANNVDFVQKVKLKTGAKTNISGTVEFQTCDDKKCLPAQKLDFNLPLK
jgi:thiol:disulfide interchange protein DsbD